MIRLLVNCCNALFTVFYIQLYTPSGAARCLIFTLCSFVHFVHWSTVILRSAQKCIISISVFAVPTDDLICVCLTLILLQWQVMKVITVDVAVCISTTSIGHCTNHWRFIVRLNSTSPVMLRHWYSFNVFTVWWIFLLNCVAMWCPLLVTDHRQPGRALLC